jgi:hypothetical protein
MTTMLERYRADPHLRIFVDAEIARAHVELQALRVLVAQQRSIITAQLDTITELQTLTRQQAKQQYMVGVERGR